MFKQRGILTCNNDVKELFFKENNSSVSFDTFFNSLNLFLVKTYTNSTKVKFHIDIDGDADIKFFFKKKGKNVELEAEKLSDGDFYIDISKLENCGILYPIITWDLNKPKIIDFYYETNCESKPISTCVLITTFNRQEFLLPNLEKLLKVENLSHVVVVDNGNNLVLPKHLINEKITVIKNKNLGGSGGFTRGLMEAYKNKYSHVFIMDDDITLIPEVIEKTISLVSSLKDDCKDYWVGYSMLPNDKPTIQYELGTYWNGYRMDINRHNINLLKEKSFEKNQINKKYNYSAWWSLMMPTSSIDKYGYPLPMFIKFDDIEYALRRTNEKIILTNGFAVWHENFDKKYNPALEYYLFRNACITNALHVRNSAFLTMWRYLRKFVRYYFTGKMIELKLIKRGYDDFAKGPEYFFSLDSEKNHAVIREIANKKQSLIKNILTAPFIALFYIFKILFSFNKHKRKYKNTINAELINKYWESVFANE